MQSCNWSCPDTPQLGQKIALQQRQKPSLSLCSSQCQVTCFQNNSLFFLLFLFTLLWGSFLLGPKYIFKAASIWFSAKTYVSLLKSIWMTSNLPLKPVIHWRLGISEDLSFGSLVRKLSKTPEMNRSCVTFQWDLNFQVQKLLVGLLKTLSWLHWKVIDLI